MDSPPGGAFGYTRGMADPERGIGPKVRALRHHLRWSQKDLSDRAEFRRSDVSLVESGHNLGTSVRIRKALAKGFGVDVRTFDAYLDGELALGKIAAKVPAGDSQARRKTKLVFSELPNLREAVMLVVRDTGMAESIVREEAVKAAAYPGVDLEKGPLGWAQLLQSRLKKLRSHVRMNPFGVPGLSMAIRMLAQEHPLEEPRIIETAVNLASQMDNPQAPSAAAWFRTLERTLGFERVEAVPEGLGPRTPKKRARRRARQA